VSSFLHVAVAEVEEAGPITGAITAKVPGMDTRTGALLLFPHLEEVAIWKQSLYPNLHRTCLKLN
jgi:hypothetical protein